MRAVPARGSGPRRKEELTRWPHLSSVEGDGAYRFRWVSKRAVGRFLARAKMLPRGPSLLFFHLFLFLFSNLFHSKLLQKSSKSNQNLNFPKI
jgi:hypothetical protein